MRTSNMRLPHVGHAGRLKPSAGLPVIVAILSPTNKQTNKQTTKQTTAAATEALTRIKFRNAADKRKDR
jgi:hypothetical protein